MKEKTKTSGTLKLFFSIVISAALIIGIAAGLTILFTEKSQVNGDFFFSEGLLPFCKTDSKYGYINKNGDVVIEPQFDSALPFENGIAVVSVNGKDVLINDRAEIIAEYDKISGFCNGLSVIQLNGKYGYINTSGEIVIIPEYTKANAFLSDGIATVSKDNENLVVDKEGKILFEIESKYTVENSNFLSRDDLIAVSNDEGKYGYMNLNGDMVVDYQFDLAGFFYSSGIARVIIDQKVGYIKKNGEYLISPQEEWLDFIYDEIEDTVYFTKKISGKATILLLDQNGNQITNEPYNNIDLISDNMFVAFKGNCCGAINNKGEVIIPFEYDSIRNFNNEIGLAVAKKDGKFGYINKQGEKIIDFKFDDASDYNNGYAAVVIDNLGFYFDNEGQIAVLLGNNKPYYASADGYFVAYDKTTNSFALFNKNSEVIIDGCYSIGGFTAPKKAG